MSCNVLNNKVSHIDSICRDPDQTFYWMDMNPDSKFYELARFLLQKMTLYTHKKHKLFLAESGSVKLIWILHDQNLDLQT